MPKKGYKQERVHRQKTLENLKKIRLGFQVGNKINSGRKKTEDHKEKISKALKGRHVSPATEFKKGIIGKESGNWKGGITPINAIIRESKEYKLWRKAVFERDNYTCRFCGQRGREIHADHIKPFALFPELRFAIDNGRTLCKSCHQKTNTYGGKLIKKIRR